MTLPFWQDGYQLVEGLLDPGKLALAAAAMDDSSRNGRMKRRTDPALINAEDEYSPLIGDMLLRHCLPKIEQVVGRELIESHAYWRIYRKGAVMVRHRDRKACEVSASLTIASQPASHSWPISIKALNGEEMPVDIPPGAGLVYQGHRIEHWRDPLEGEEQKQLFLFYLLKDGDFTEHAHDRVDGQGPREWKRS